LLTPHQPDEATLAVRKGQETINRVARRLIQEKKQKIQEGEESGKAYGGRDLRSLLRASSTPSTISSYPV
jgi:hypothetical protein